MAYGIEVLNSSGRVLFTTEDAYSCLSGGTPVSNAADGIAVPSVAAGQVLFARPQDNESGVVSTTTNNGHVFFGVNSYQWAWGAVRGIKHVTVRPISNRTPATSGYGLEVYNSSNVVVFSSLVPNYLSIEAVVPLRWGDTFTFYNTGGEFNNVYISVQGLFLSYVDLPGINIYHSISGSYAYFNNTAQTVTVYNNGNDSNSSGLQNYYYNLDYDRQGSIGVGNVVVVIGKLKGG